MSLRQLRCPRQMRTTYGLPVFTGVQTEHVIPVDFMVSVESMPTTPDLGTLAVCVMLTAGS
jgi:hypothetical protein